METNRSPRKPLTKADKRRIALALRFELAQEKPELLALLRQPTTRSEERS